MRTSVNFNKYPVPPRYADKVAQDSVRFARETMKGYGWSDRSIQSIEPMSQNGQVGIRTSTKYLMYQEEGTRPFLMHWVAGRTIPIQNKNLPTNFVRGGNVGLPGYVTIPGRGKVWRDQRWLHPGLQPRKFMSNAVDRSVRENVPTIRRWALRLLGIARGQR